MEGNEIYVLNIVKLIEFVDMLVICCNNFFNGISEYCIEGCFKVMVVCYFGNGVGYIWYVVIWMGMGVVLLLFIILIRGGVRIVEENLEYIEKMDMLMLN